MICTEEVCSHTWLSPHMPTTSCWITSASFNTGVFSFYRLYYANLFEVMHAYATIYICLCVITWTLMLSFKRHDSTARCVCVARGNAAAIEFSRSNGQYKPDPVSSERQRLLIQCTSVLLGETEQLCQSRKQNVTSMTAGLAHCGGAQHSSWMALVAAPPGCWVPQCGGASFP